MQTQRRHKEALILIRSICVLFVVEDGLNRTLMATAPFQQPSLRSAGWGTFPFLFDPAILAALPISLRSCSP
jgi:hypothetical protein